MNNLKTLVNFWTKNLANEQTLESLQNNLKNLCAPPDVKEMWGELEQRQWLKQGASGLFGLVPQALHYAEHNPTRISRAKALDIVQEMCSRIRVWNEYANKRNLPSIAATAVWGSVARASTPDHGDVDVCLLWRRSSSLAHPERSVTAPVVCDENDTWDIEDKVEQWVAFHPLINISGIDQWEEFGLQEDFCAYLVFTDCSWEQGDDTGIPLIQSQTMRRFASRQLEIAPKCAKIHKR